MKGIYFLVVEIRKYVKKKIGALGKIELSPGIYIYVGSAQKNLEKRLSRHLSPEKKKFWHIDYILDGSTAQVKAIFIKKNAEKKEECASANLIKKIGTPIKAFGSSDCKCISHFFKISNLKGLRNLSKQLKFINIDIHQYINERTDDI